MVRLILSFVVMSTILFGCAQPPIRNDDYWGRAAITYKNMNEKSL